MKPKVAILASVALLLAAGWFIGSPAKLLFIYWMLCPLVALLCIPFLLFFFVKFLQAWYQTSEVNLRRPSFVRLMITCGILLLALIPEMLSLLDLRGRNSHEPEFHQSADKLYTLRIERYFKWPPTDLIDPSVFISATLLESKTNREISQATKLLADRSHLTEHTVSWESDGVTVSGYNRRHPEQSLHLEFSDALVAKLKPE